MALRDRLRRLTAPVEELDQERLRTQCALPGVTPLADLAGRGPARVCGEVLSMRIVPRAGAPSLEVTIDDGTGRATAVFFGRKKVLGITPGRRLVLEGAAAPERNRVLFYNPAYDLQP
ncbi:MAG: OB-fold nucleic acid binding domain-containing protein [Acidimicrobiales bacterium]